MTSVLSNASYLEADAFVRERRTLFARAWQMAAHEAALAEPGDYVCHGLPGLPVFVMRDEAGTLGAHLNLCRHQNLPVLDAGAGTLAQLRCRYHGWTYRFDGRFKEAPLKYEPANPTLPEHGLRKVALREWRGLVFVSAEGTEAAFAAASAALEAALPAGLPRAAELVTDFACNWKLVMEQWLGGRGAAWPWLFPTLALEAGGEGPVVHQLIARTHERTRVVSHILAGDPFLAEPVKAALAVDKAGAEALQAAAAQGAAPAAAAAGSALAAFRARVAAADQG